MKKVAPKQSAEPKKTISDVMSKYDAFFSISLHNGFAQIKFVDQKMFVTWLNDEGYADEDGQDVPLEDIERVADFMRELKNLRLTEYSKDD